MRTLLILLFLNAVVLSAQQKDRHLPKGNDAFADKKYAEAEANYRMSSSQSPKKAEASYNLGNAIYKQKEAGEAKYAYRKSIENATTLPEKHLAYHNLGNVLMKEKNYQGAVEAYMNALRNDPSDEQSRYNFALAKKMLKDNPPKKDKDKKDKDKKKDKEDKDKKDDKKEPDKKDQDKNNEDKKDKGQPKPKDQGQPQPQPGDIPKKRLQNLLDAVNNEEKKVQDKVKAKQMKPKTVKTEKDW